MRASISVIMLPHQRFHNMRVEGRKRTGPECCDQPPPTPFMFSIHCCSETVLCFATLAWPACWHLQPAGTAPCPSCTPTAAGQQARSAAGQHVARGRTPGARAACELQYARRQGSLGANTDVQHEGWRATRKTEQNVTPQHKGSPALSAHFYSWLAPALQAPQWMFALCRWIQRALAQRGHTSSFAHRSSSGRGGTASNHAIRRAATCPCRHVRVLWIAALSLVCNTDGIAAERMRGLSHTSLVDC